MADWWPNGHRRTDEGHDAGGATSPPTCLLRGAAGLLCGHRFRPRGEGLTDDRTEGTMATDG